MKGKFSTGDIFPLNEITHLISKDYHDKKFAEQYVKNVMNEGNEEDLINLKSLVIRDNQGNLRAHDNDTVFKQALNYFIVNEANENQLVRIISMDLRDKEAKNYTREAAQKVGSAPSKTALKTLAQKHPETFKIMLATENMRLEIRRYKLTELEVGGESLLKSCMVNDQLAATMMKEGFTLSKEEIPEKYKDQYLTVNDNLRIAIATKANQLDKLDLSKKQSPLALAIKMGQTGLAEALKDKGYKLKKTELMMRKMKNAYKKMPSFSIPNIMRKNKESKGQKR